MQKKLEALNGNISKELLHRAKRIGFSDYQISKMIKKTEIYVRDLRESHKIKPVVKQLDTVAAEYPCFTNYLYLTYNGDYNDIGFDEETIIVLGSGVYRIGSSVEFDWCAVNCVRELRSQGYKTVMINYNPETVSTDYDEVDRLYFDEITFESVMDIYGFENCKGVILSMGGQIANNIAMSLHRKQVKIIGTNPENIDNAENRFKFSRMLDDIGIDQPKWRELTTSSSAKSFSDEVGYPCLVRPSYVLSGAMMCVIYSQEEMDTYLENVIVSNDYPVVISKFIIGAKEIEVDAVADKGILKLWAISEHVEDAGVHSGDATLILPAKNINKDTKQLLLLNTQKIAKKLEIDGPFNIQYIAKNNELKVIECNLRVSRSFPFVSKVKDINFIRTATQIMMGTKYEIQDKPEQYTGVKVSQFSFNRLANADNRLGVEMLSTGEVACFGENYQEAYLKALKATGFKIKNKCNVLVSIGSLENKNELLESIKLLSENGFTLYGTCGTSSYYNEQGINMIELDTDAIYKYIKEGLFGLSINISIPNKIRTLEKTPGYFIRRLCIDYCTDILVNIKCTKLYIDSIVNYCDNSKKIGDCDVHISDNSPIFSTEHPSDNDSDENDDIENINNIAIINNKPEHKINCVIDVSQFTRDNLRILFRNSCIIKQNIKKHGKLDILKGKTIGLYFDEPSSRTYGSFYVAVKKLGGDVLSLNNSNSSSKKGESLYDTLKCIETYCDLVVVRTRSTESLRDLQTRIKIPIINAGNGHGEHPTQALLDVFTIREERGTVNKLVVSIVGDLKYGRTVHSLVRLLSHYIITFNFVSVEELMMDQDTLDFLHERNIKYNTYTSINDVIETTDILYMTRIQQERLQGEEINNEYIENNLYLTQEILTNAKQNLVIMHPLPRNQEINTTIDNDPRAAYFRQMENGLYVRMALMLLLLK